MAVTVCSPPGRVHHLAQSSLWLGAFVVLVYVIHGLMCLWIQCSSLLDPFILPAIPFPFSLKRPICQMLHAYCDLLAQILFQQVSALENAPRCMI